LVGYLGKGRDGSEERTSLTLRVSDPIGCGVVS